MDSVLQILTNFIRGECVKDSSELLRLAIDKKSVYHPVWGLKPASVIINMNFAIVHKALYNKTLFKTIKITKLKSIKK